MSDETFVCESCGHRKMLEDGCVHDWYSIHNWCTDCCEDSGYNERDEPRYDRNDMD